jgi:arsenate reductase
MKKILILCTGNSCRSQMAEAILKSFDNTLSVFSAGTKPERIVNPNAVRVIEELGLSLDGHYPKNVNDFVDEEFDYLITVCDSARQICPIFTGKVKNKLHIGFEDPADAVGTKEEILDFYRKIRDQIKDKFFGFYKEIKEN